MMRALFIGLVVLASAPALGAPPPVKGELRAAGGQRLLVVRGTHREMGLAHGRLLAAAIREVVGRYAVANLGVANFRLAAALYKRVASVPAPLVEASRG
jgi:hypothetical protein